MAVTLDATVGGAAANTYVALAPADEYFEGVPLSTAWDGATDDQKNRALVAATARIDQEEFPGEPVNPITGTSSGTTQALQFPRRGVLDRNGNEYDATVIPGPITRGTLKLAYIFLDDPSFLAATGLEGFERMKVGPIEMVPRHYRAAGDLPSDVARELVGVVGGGLAHVNFRVYRG